MKEKTFIINPGHATVHTKYTIVLSKPQYSIPKVYIAKELKNGKKVPSVKPGKQWHVYFYFRNPKTDKMQKFMYKESINMYKTVAERKEYGKQLAGQYHELLKMGFDPFSKNGLPVHGFEEDVSMNVIAAIDEVIEHKSNSWKASTANDMKLRLNHFKDWCKKVGVDELEAQDLTKRHIIAFLKSLTHLSNTSVNNYRRALSAVFGVMSGEGTITTNIASGIPNLKSKPKKNIPFTPKEIQNIKEYLLKTDPYLYDYIKFIFYGFLRPAEVVRLEPKFIDVENKIYRVETKKDAFKTKVLVPQLLQIVEKHNLNIPGNDVYFFTKNDQPGIWPNREKYRYNHFNKRFAKVKEHFKFSKLYGLYSFRHSAALDQYAYFQKQGLSEGEIIQKMLPITGHKTEQSLRSYLREVGSNLPTGYASNFSIDL